MRSANDTGPTVQRHRQPAHRLTPKIHTCLVDHGNYPFLFDLVAEWPSRLGRMSYLFAYEQLGRNTAVATLDASPSGGLIRGIHVPRTAPSNRFVSRFWTERQAASVAIEQLNLLNPDVVIGANNPLAVQARVLKWCRDRERPFIFWLQDLRGLAARSILKKRIPAFGGLVSRYYISLKRRLLKQSSHVISITDAFCSEVLSTGLPENQLSVIPNWAPISRLPLRPKDNEWSRSTGLLGKKVALYTGNLGMKHNPEHLLALCNALKGQPNVAVAVVAEGVGATWLAQQATARGLTNLFTYPFVSANRLPDVLGSADVFIALLEKDASAFSVPSKIWTYFCGAKPLVLSMPSDNQAALIVQQLGAGVCSDPSDQPQFVKNCLDMLSKSGAERARIGERGRAYAESNFETDHIVNRVSGCIELVLVGGEVGEAALAARS